MKSISRSHWDILRWDVIEVIITHSKEVPTDGRSIVGLRGVSHGTILIQTNTLCGEGIEFRLSETNGQDMGELNE
jgi:hypothetical protein